MAPPESTITHTKRQRGGMWNGKKCETRKSDFVDREGIIDQKRKLTVQKNKYWWNSGRERGGGHSVTAACFKVYYIQ